MARRERADRSRLETLTMAKAREEKEEARARVREIAAEFADRGDQLGWFDEVYKQAAGSTDSIPWADMEPNRFFKAWAEEKDLQGNGRKALVVGCGLGDDAKFLDDLGFDVTAFDISANAIEWARKLHKDTDIQFEVGDLFQPHRGWLGAFQFVLEIYTIQPLPMELRSRAIDAVASFVADGGELVVVCRGRDDGEEVDQLPYPLSKEDLSQFERAGLEQVDFREVKDDIDDERRFVVHYRRPN
jgi:SAM-dependent methyltransferase